MLDLDYSCETCPSLSDCHDTVSTYKKSIILISRDCIHAMYDDQKR